MHRLIRNVSQFRNYWMEFLLLLNNFTQTTWTQRHCNVFFISIYTLPELFSFSNTALSTHPLRAALISIYGLKVTPTQTHFFPYTGSRTSPNPSRTHFHSCPQRHVVSELLSFPNMGLKTCPLRATHFHIEAQGHAHSETQSFAYKAARTCPLRDTLISIYRQQHIHF